uniref:DUF7083 domain-containing protein n=1 Tax=Anopheles dirus TaxID=7168 RepID=A0A182NMZ0_9DIPT
MNPSDPNGDQQPSRSRHADHQQPGVHEANHSTAWILETFKQQQAILHQQQETFMKQQECFLTRMISTISVREAVTEFRYDPEEGVTFAAWFGRYEDMFDKDAAKLTDDAKVRLLLRKLGTKEHERYNSYILPHKASIYRLDYLSELWNLHSVYPIKLLDLSFMTRVKLYGQLLKRFIYRFLHVKTPKE